jgi:ribonuclease BN (tRNA processing enzyme)
MEILFCGVRGSTPRSGPGYELFGGHTTCALITGAGGERLLLDAGSGVQLASEALADDPQRKLQVLFTHLHLDHVLGLPMLGVLYTNDWDIDLHAAPGLVSALNHLVAPPFWPIKLGAMPSPPKIHEIAIDTISPDVVALRHGGLEVRGTPMPHPNGCTVWRVDDTVSGHALVFATDIEWSAAGEKHRAQFLDLCRSPRPADLLIMDGHFTDEELPSREGWGHSSVEQCIEIARTTGIPRLKVTHHAPENRDKRLLDIEHSAQALWLGASLARQGEVLDLSAEQRPERTSS